MERITFKWKKDDVELLDNNEKIGIIIESLKNAGVYSCQAFDFENSVESNIDSSRLSVYEKKAHKKIELSITSNQPIKDKTIFVKPFESVILNCVISQTNRSLSVDWIKVNDVMDIDFYLKSNDNRELNIFDIQPEQSGKYECQVKANDQQTEQVIDYVNIFVEKIHTTTQQSSVTFSTSVPSTIVSTLFTTSATTARTIKTTRQSISKSTESSNMKFIFTKNEAIELDFGSNIDFYCVNETVEV